MRVLLIDAGNSRIKWAVHDSSDWRAEGAVATDAVQGLAAQWQTLQTIDRVLYCCVAAENVAAAIADGVHSALGLVPLRFQSRSQIGAFHNAYEDPARLGPDRLAAALGAWQHCQDHLVVVMAGTAVTVDMVAAEGSFLGGLILPGMRLMRESLHRGAAALPVATGTAQDIPGNTDAAIATGIQDALLGAIERVCARFGARCGRPPQLFLSGGDAVVLQPHLQGARVIPNLVLEGLRQAIPSLD